MDLQLRGTVAMVAAASRGLGYGVARALAGEGASVSIASRTEADISAAAERIANETGSRAIGCVMDARDADSILRWTDATVEAFGGVDCLLVNAGGPPAGTFDNFDDDAWQAAFELTLLSAIRMIRAVLPAMRARGGGSILAVTSASIKEPIDNLLLSNVLRSGVAGLLKSLSRELAGDGIRVNDLVPGRFDTDRVRELDAINAGNRGVSPAEQKAHMEAAVPLGRYGTTEEFGRAAAFLLSPAANYVTGETFVVDGGTMHTVW